MRPFLITLAVAVGLGGVAGWLAAGGGVNTARSDQQDWSLAAAPDLGRDKQEALFTALMETNHFGAESTDEPAPANAVEIDNQAPRIAAAWVIGDEIAIGFHGSSEGLITAGIGDSLPGGWVVVDATLEKVIIERDGEAREIEVFAYDNAGT